MTIVSNYRKNNDFLLNSLTTIDTGCDGLMIVPCDTSKNLISSYVGMSRKLLRCEVSARFAGQFD